MILKDNDSPSSRVELQPLPLVCLGYNYCTVYTQMYWYTLSRLYMQGVFRRIELAKQVTSNTSFEKYTSLFIEFRI